MTVDIEYANHGLFTRFYPVTAAGEDAWRVMAKDDGVAAVLAMHAANVIAQLRKAGYRVAKAKTVKQSTDELLAELRVL